MEACCKHCGSECDDASNDDRFSYLHKLIVDTRLAEKEYESLKSELDKLTRELEADWGHIIDLEIY